MTPQPPSENTFFTIQLSLARLEEGQKSLAGDFQEMKSDQKETRNEQKDFRKEFGTLATMVNTLQGQISALQSQATSIQAQVNGLLQWQLSIIQQRGADTMTTNDRINTVQTGGLKSVIGAQAVPLGIILSLALGAVAQYFLHVFGH